MGCNRTFNKKLEKVYTENLWVPDCIGITDCPFKNLKEWIID